MEPLHLSVGCGDYDRTRALFDGTVRPEGVELAWEPVHVPHELFVRVLRGEFDVAEMSLAGLTTSIARGDNELVAIPVVTSRLFRHSFIWVNPESGIEQPADLIGRKVGVTDYSVSAAVWLRGMLQHDYGVAPESIHWFLGGLNAPGHVVPLETRRPMDVRVEAIPEGTSLGGLLEAGKLDAVMAPGVLEVFKRGSPRVRRLFPNYQEVEADYYRRTGIVPIMHMIVIRRRVYEANPWVARSLYDGFVEAKRLCYKRMDDTGAAAASLVWLQAHLEAERAVFGPDHWPYGFAPIRKTVEALTTYVYEQGLSDRQVAVEELFAPELLDPS